MVISYLMKDEDVVCIKDINPASTHHYLIIPKIHIVNAKHLKKEDEQLCKCTSHAVKPKKLEN